MMANAAIGAEYERLLELGRGGMGAAYLSRAVGALGFERLVVAKRLLPHLMEHPEAVSRFLAEARVAAALHHANIVGVHYAGKDEDGYFIVYDYVEGAALDELVDRLALRGAALPVPVLLRIALDALTGLHAAHTAKDHAGSPLGILHRDISPENLLVGRDGVTRVLDFGIAKSSIASVTTDQNYLLGKLMYMAPEYLSRAPVGPSLDVYALGVSLWVSLTGSSPWPGSSEAQLVMRIATEGVPRLSAFGLKVPPSVDDMLARATALDPRERFADALEMVDAIEQLARDTGWLASHREVAALVEGQLGVDLDRRRAHVSSLLGHQQLGEVESLGGAGPLGGGEPRQRGASTAHQALGRADTQLHSDAAPTRPFELSAPRAGASLQVSEPHVAEARAGEPHVAVAQTGESRAGQALTQESHHDLLSVPSGPQAHPASALTSPLAESPSVTPSSGALTSGALSNAALSSATLSSAATGAPLTLASVGAPPQRRAQLWWAVGVGVLLLGGGVLAASLIGGRPVASGELAEPSGGALVAPVPQDLAAPDLAAPNLAAADPAPAATEDASARSQVGAQAEPSTTPAASGERPEPRAAPPTSPQLKSPRPATPRPKPQSEPGGITKTNPYR